MEYAYTNEVKAIVADTYLAYTSEIDGAEAFRRFVSNSAVSGDIRRDPKFSSFTHEEIVDEMKLMEHDIVELFKRHLHLVK